MAEANGSGEAGWISELQALGFSEYEARCYLTLLRVQPATAYEIAKQARLQRPNVYGAIEGLEKKGAVQPISTHPARYVPVSPERLLDGIATATSRRCRDLGITLSAIDQADATEYVWLVEGERAIFDKIEEMIAQAKAHVWIKAPLSRLAPHEPALRAAAARGLSIILVLFGDLEDIRDLDLGPGVKVYAHEGNGVVVGQGDALVTITVDFSEALTVNTSGRGHGAHTRSGPIVGLAESLIRHEIYLAEIFARFGDGIEAAFGPALLALRRIYLDKNEVEKLMLTLEDVAGETGDTYAGRRAP